MYSLDNIGWAPSQFKSSRVQKADRRDFAPEDFMDEEDKAVSV